MDLEWAVEAVLTSPLGGALFLAADQQHLGAEDLLDPVRMTALASVVAADLDPWRGDLPERRKLVLTEAAVLRSLVTEVVTDPRSAWWWTPMDRARQLALTDPGLSITVDEPVGPVQAWEIYAQRRAIGGLETATELSATAINEQIRSGLHAQLAVGHSDWQPSYPLHQTRLRVGETARIYEVNSPADWHHLARTYGDPATYRGTDQNLLNAAGLHHGIGPTWSAVADDWDGVHLTFGGYLTALDVPVTTDGVTTTLWVANSERTLWLRNVFTGRDTLPDLLLPPILSRVGALNGRTGGSGG